MGGRGTSMGGSHGMGGGGGAAKAASAAPQTREQQLLARIQGDPTALMQMSDQDAADTVAAIEKLPIATDGTERDCFIQRYMNAIGWSNNKPTVLDDNAYEKARKQAGEESMYHSAKNFGGKTGDVFNNQLMTGKTAYASEGYYGAGTYWAHNDAGASGSYGPHQVKAFLNKKAKLVTTYTLNQEWHRIAVKKPRLFAAIKNAGGGYGGNAEALYPVIAASMGRNVILNNRFDGRSSRYKGQYVVTLDRSATTMSSKKVSNARDDTSNW